MDGRKSWGTTYHGTRSISMSYGEFSCFPIVGIIQSGFPFIFSALGQMRYWRLDQTRSLAKKAISALTRINFVRSQVAASRTGRDAVGSILLQALAHHVETGCASCRSMKPSNRVSTSISHRPNICTSLHPLARRSRFVLR